MSEGASKGRTCNSQLDPKENYKRTILDVEREKIFLVDCSFVKMSITFGTKIC